MTVCVFFYSIFTTPTSVTQPHNIKNNLTHSGFMPQPQLNSNTPAAPLTSSGRAQADRNVRQQRGPAQGRRPAQLRPILRSIGTVAWSLCARAATLDRPNTNRTMRTCPIAASRPNLNVPFAPGVSRVRRIWTGTSARYTPTCMREIQLNRNLLAGNQLGAPVVML